MLAERILQNKSELMSMIDKWSVNDEKLIVFERDDTLVLKKMNRKMSNFANNAHDDDMTMEDVVKEVHKIRSTK